MSEETKQLIAVLAFSAVMIIILATASLFGVDL